MSKSVHDFILIYFRLFSDVTLKVELLVCSKISILTPLYIEFCKSSSTRLFSGMLFRF